MGNEATQRSAKKKAHQAEHDKRKDKECIWRQIGIWSAYLSSNFKDTDKSCLSLKSPSEAILSCCGLDFEEIRHCKDFGYLDIKEEKIISQLAFELDHNTPGITTMIYIIEVKIIGEFN